MTAVKDTRDFSQGPVWQIILRQSLPLMAAQFVQLAYNIVDRIYIGHMAGVGSMALTGIGLVFPITTLITGFTNLFGMGGAPMFSMARGAKDNKRAERILGQVVSMLCISAVILFILCYLYRRPILYLFGASDDSYGYADSYLRVYLLGTAFTMLSGGLNNYINAQGYPRIGMATVMLGAVLNLILDPIFIFLFNMGVVGAAIATVISQLASCLWVIQFFAGAKNQYRIRKENLVPNWTLIRQMLALGTPSFVMQATNGLVQIACNATLRIYGGDLYVGIMTVLNSVRDVFSLPAHSITNGAQPVLGFNYGARKYKRVRGAIRFTCLIAVLYTAVAWLVVFVFPRQIMGIFTTDTAMLDAGTHCLRVYFFGFFFMACQFGGQSCFTALGCAKRAIFFSLLRKVVIVVPLTLLLPMLGFGVNGVLLAEPISNATGAVACIITMYFTLYRRLPKEDE